MTLKRTAPQLEPDPPQKKQRTDEMAAKMQSPSLRKKENGPKKLVIKNFKGITTDDIWNHDPERPQLPADFEAQTWHKLKTAVQAIHTGRPVEESLEELYRATEDMCTHKMAANLYNNLTTECSQHIQQEVNKLLKYPAQLLSIILFFLI